MLALDVLAARLNALLADLDPAEIEHSCGGLRGVPRQRDGARNLVHYSRMSEVQVKSRTLVRRIRSWEGQ